MILKTEMIVLWVCAIAFSSFGTTVEWNLMHSDDSEVWDSGPIWFVGGTSKANSNFYCNFFVTHDYCNYMAGEAIKPAPFDSIWLCQATYGDVVDHDSMFHTDQKYFYSWQGDTSTLTSDYSIPIDWNDTVYLAMATIAYDANAGGEYMVYGWLELGMNGGDPIVKGSAWDVDGGAMYVGGGAVPEPTSALLLLLGVAALALRRRTF